LKCENRKIQRERERGGRGGERGKGGESQTVRERGERKENGRMCVLVCRNNVVLIFFVQFTRLATLIDSRHVCG
jgi:hypothetical protein